MQRWQRMEGIHISKLYQPVSNTKNEMAGFTWKDWSGIGVHPNHWLSGEGDKVKNV